MCYTNHAFDQFCEGIVQLTNKIVRIGGQTKSQIMKDYTLRSVTKRHRLLQGNSNYKVKSLLTGIKNIIKIITRYNSF